MNPILVVWFAATVLGCFIPVLYDAWLAMPKTVMVYRTKTATVVGELNAIEALWYGAVVFEGSVDAVPAYCSLWQRVLGAIAVAVASDLDVKEVEVVRAACVAPVCDSNVICLVDGVFAAAREVAAGVVVVEQRFFTGVTVAEMSSFGYELVYLS